MKLLIIISVVILFLLAAYGLGPWSFQRKVLQARDAVSQTAAAATPAVITESDLTALPVAVKKWLLVSGAVGKPKVTSTQLLQSGLMRLKPEQTTWIACEAEQIINSTTPGFVWNVKMSINGLPVLGVDQFNQGAGSMLITLLGIIPIVNVSQNAKINQSALQRYLGEIIWTPSTALAPFIEWTHLDDQSAKAKMTVNGVSGEAVFYFSETGDLKKFVAMRFKDINDEKPLEWHADIKEVKTFNGVRVPSSLEATWMLSSGAFTWFKFEITSLTYN